MTPPLTLDQIKKHLRIALADTSEDELLDIYLAAAVGAFKKESKRRWPKDEEPTDTEGVYVDLIVLDEDEQGIAKSWLLFTVAHLFENRQSVVADTRAVAVEVPLTARSLMNLIREPTL